MRITVLRMGVMSELAIFEDYRSRCGLVFCFACRHQSLNVNMEMRGIIWDKTINTEHTSVIEILLLLFPFLIY